MTSWALSYWTKRNTRTNISDPIHFVRRQDGTLTHITGYTPHINSQSCTLRLPKINLILMSLICKNSRSEYKFQCKYGENKPNEREKEWRRREKDTKIHLIGSFCQRHSDLFIRNATTTFIHSVSLCRLFRVYDFIKLEMTLSNQFKYASNPNALTKSNQINDKRLAIECSPRAFLRCALEVV